MAKISIMNTILLRAYLLFLLEGVFDEAALERLDAVFFGMTLRSL